MYANDKLEMYWSTVTALSKGVTDRQLPGLWVGWLETTAGWMRLSRAVGLWETQWLLSPCGAEGSRDTCVRGCT